MRPLIRLAAVALLALLASSAAAQVTPPRLQEFPFAVGAGGYAVNDAGRAADVGSFSNAGFEAYGEVVLEPGVLLQARYQNFTLPGTPAVPPPFGTPTTAPDVRVNAGVMSVGYLFREHWWDAGIVAGVGIYWLNPNAPSADQSVIDVKETVIGWHGGLLVSVQLARRLDLRAEFNAYLLRTDVTHKPITLGGSLAYHF